METNSDSDIQEILTLLEKQHQTAERNLTVFKEASKKVDYLEEVLEMAVQRDIITREQFNEIADMKLVDARERFERLHNEVISVFA